MIIKEMSVQEKQLFIDENQNVHIDKETSITINNYLTIYLDKFLATHSSFDSFFKKNDIRLVFLQEYFDNIVNQTIQKYTH